MIGLLLALCGTALANPRVAVLVSDDLEPYTEPIQAFQEALGQEVHTFHLHGRKSEAERAAKRIKSLDPEAVLCLGAKACYTMATELPYIPTVYAAVNEPERYGIASSQITGVATSVPAERAVSEFLGFFPDAQKVGLLAPEGGSARVEALAAAMKEQGIDARIQKVDKPSQVSRALYALAPTVDALWLVPDRELITQRSYRVLVEEARRQRLPLAVESINMVRAGGLFAVVADPNGVGRQAARMVAQILDGAAPGIIPAEEPVDTRIALNLRMIKAAELPFDELLVDFVDVTVE